MRIKWSAPSDCTRPLGHQGKTQIDCSSCNRWPAVSGQIRHDQIRGLLGSANSQQHVERTDDLKLTIFRWGHRRRIA